MERQRKSYTKPKIKPENKVIVVDKVMFEVSYEDSLLIINTLLKTQELVNSLRSQLDIQVINCATKQGIKIS